MNLKLLIFILFIIVVGLSGCLSSNNAQEVPKPSPSAINTAPAIPQSIVTVTHLSQKPLQFQISDINPVKSVALSEFTLDHQTVIFATSTLTQKLFRFSPLTFAPLPVSLPSKAWIDSIEFSPDGKWFIYYLAKSDGQNGDFAHNGLWLRSVATGDQSLIIKDLEGDFLATWLSNKEIVIWRHYSRALNCPGEVRILDPFLKKEKTLPILPPGGRNYCFSIPILNPDRSKAIYLQENKGWKQIDYGTMSVTNILPTLEDRDTSPVGGKYFFWGSNGLNFAFPDTRTNQIRFAINLNETEMAEQTEFKYVRLPENLHMINDHFDWYDLGKDMVAFDTEKMTDGITSESTFAIANLENLTLKNYFINRGSFAGYNGEAWSIFSSSDGRFLGWAIMKTPENDPALGSVILDTQTGEATFLKDYQIMGFGENEP